MTNQRLYGYPMTESYCEMLGPRLSEEDLRDCAAHDFDGTLALKSALGGGPCLGVFWEDHSLLGAMGWTFEGFIWSLWGDLTAEQGRELMKWAPSVIQEMAREAGRPLCNVVWEGNRRTIAWLKATHCFDFLPCTHEYKGLNWLPFFVKPLGELAHV